MSSIADRVVAGRHRPPVDIKSEHISSIKTEDDEDTRAYHLDTDNEEQQDDRQIKKEDIKEEEYGTTDDEGEGDTDDDTDDECVLLGVIKGKPKELRRSSRLASTSTPISSDAKPGSRRSPRLARTSKDTNTSKSKGQNTRVVSVDEPDKKRRGVKRTRKVAQDKDTPTTRSSRKKAHIKRKSKDDSIPRPKQARKLCSHKACKSYARRNGVCVRHGAKSAVKYCSHKKCSNMAVKGGVCKTHGARVVRKTCTHKGCDKWAQKGGVCQKHGAKKKTCKRKGCTKTVQSGGLCRMHGATKKTCKRKGCTNYVQQKGGVCRKHGKRLKSDICSHVGCTKWVQKGGLCASHGRKR